MTPSVAITKTDGNLGVASDTDRILAIVGPASSGAFDTPTPLTNKADILAAFTSGLLVEAGVYMVARGIPVALIRSSPTTAGAYGTITHSAVLGTAMIAHGGGVPDADYDVIVEILTGGALGTTGIVFRYSLDNGVNFSDPQSLGTGLTLTCARGVNFTLSASTDTLLTGDKFTVTTTGPKNLTADIADSFTGLTGYSGEWLRVLVLGADADATILAQCDAFAKSFHAEGKYPEVIANTRVKAGGESEATYLAAMAVISAAVQSTEVSPAVDQCEMVSEVNGWRLRLPQAIAYAARLMTIDDSHDAAAVADGALTGVFLETAAGVRNYHDERRNPGLDALGFTTMRTWGGRPVMPGVYINNPRLLGGSGSDFRYFQLSAILNRAIEKTFYLLRPRLSAGVLCDPTTGRIREDVAKGIEDSVSAELQTEFKDSGRCSAIKMTLSRTDNILSTDSVHFDVQQIPLAFIKKFIGKAGLVRTLAVVPTT